VQDTESASIPFKAFQYIHPLSLPTKQIAHNSRYSERIITDRLLVIRGSTIAVDVEVGKANGSGIVRVAIRVLGLELKYCFSPQNRVKFSGQRVETRVVNPQERIVDIVMPFMSIMFTLRQVCHRTRVGNYFSVPGNLGRAHEGILRIPKFHHGEVRNEGGKMQL
jgi:hypothetical protein